LLIADCGFLIENLTMAQLFNQQSTINNCIPGQCFSAK